MARKERTVIDVTDDLTGELTEDGELIEFSLRGNYYEIDLGPANAKRLDDALAPFIIAARKTSAPQKTTAGKTRRSRSDEPKKIREWAAKQGHQIPPRGRIPVEIVAAYRAQKSEQTATVNRVEAAANSADTL